MPPEQPEEQSDIVKILLSVQTDKVGSRTECTYTIDREEWDDMDEIEREGHMYQQLWELDMFQWGWEKQA